MSDPIRIVAVRWKCPHCPRSRSSKTAIVAHIRRCWLNPATRSCRTCRHFQPATGSYDGDPGTDEECGAGVGLSRCPTVPVTGCDLWAALEEES